MTSHESAHDRARRLLLEGRVIVRRVDGADVRADVRGDSATLRTVTHTPGRGWACTCPARTTCAHTLATMLVVLTDQEARP